MRKDLEEKVEHSIARIKKAEKLALSFQPEIGFYLGFSGGKDSQVIYDLTKRAGVKFFAQYSCTTIDPPDNVKFIRDFYPDVKFKLPKMNFYKAVEKRGLPTMIARFCCDILKERDGKGFVNILGVRRAESVKRSKYQELESGKFIPHDLDQLTETNYQCMKSGKEALRFYPILTWTEEDVWDYIHERKLPINPCYEHAGRVGCMLCPFSSKKQLGYYINRYPRVKDRLLKAIQKNIDDRKNDPKRKDAYFKDAQDQYDWWISRKSIKDYEAMKQKQRQREEELKAFDKLTAEKETKTE